MLSHPTFAQYLAPRKDFYIVPFEDVVLVIDPKECKPVALRLMFVIQAR